ncbi:DNA-protecting protein DprA [Vibrio sp. HA2012]|uniref:DNA-processing protein DprA n=1 Tax=Vibrio sp. HA2012 TaxID=1971595 RepID=UPI000C2BAD47|nr:DNA-processing protein DprA [Vibrio sp. HA2012]PJC85162.1 DNA-protecting protein DprA [Vibrio sp. HA2012]
MTEQELSAWLALSFMPGIGGKRLTRLLSIDSPACLVGASRERLESVGLKPAQIHYLRYESDQVVESCLHWLQAASLHHIITPLCVGYPPLLKEISAYPPVLFVKGSLSLLSEPQLAIVGSRNASREGLDTARSFAGDLARQGVTITSGLALGVDGYAHDGALKAGGDTIAVLGSGLDNLYPRRHKPLAERIIEHGALVSEFRPDAPPMAEHFPRRNRIISGLASGVLVIEAAERSGSLITARYACEQSRDVFVLPGSIHHPNSRGGNHLIREGATLVQTSEDILQEISHLIKWSLSGQNTLFQEEVEKEQLPFPELLANVGEKEAVPVDILAQRTHIPVHEIMMQLLELELQGHVAAVPGGYIRMRRG